MTAAIVQVGAARIGLDEVFARMPFRFGVVTIEAAVAATIELDLAVDGIPAKGYASEILAYKWFDKRPEKSPADNVADLLSILNDALARAATLPPSDIFTLWRSLDSQMRAAAPAQGFNGLMAGYGTSMVERAMLDGAGRARGESLWQMLQNGTTGLSPAEIFAELAGMPPAAALPSKPLSEVRIRHTVGMLDPMDDADLPRAERRDDGLPETLEDYLRQGGIRYLKVKVGGDAASDLQRLRRIAGLLDRVGEDVKLTLDGNEQFGSLDAFATFMQAVRSDAALNRLIAATMFIEQPIERAQALSAPLDRRALEVIGLPLLIDEADDAPDAFARAIALGYRGVSHKNCKGVFRSVMNAMLARHHSATSGAAFFLSAEDLSCLPVAGLNADLAVVAALGIGHVERNGHHFFDGMAHLPPADVAAALAEHPDLYHVHDRVGGRLTTHGGRLRLGSLQRPGMGFPVPDLNARIAPEDWSFDRLTTRNQKKR